MTRRPPLIWPSTIGFGTTLFSGPIVSTILLAWSETITLSGTSSASASPAKTRSRPKVPGVRNWSGLGKTTRPRIVPERAFSVLSTKSIRPRRFHSCSSDRRTSATMPDSREAVVRRSLARRCQRR